MMSELRLCQMKAKLSYNTPTLTTLIVTEIKHPVLKWFMNSEVIRPLTRAFSLLKEHLKKVKAPERKADEIISSLGAELCHDVNNPLAIISGLNEQLTLRLADQQNMTEEFRNHLLKHIKMTERSIKRIANTTDSVREKTVASIKRLDNERSYYLSCSVK
jgi:signal transduction histidine kinase